MGDTNDSINTDKKLQPDNEKQQQDSNLQKPNGKKSHKLPKAVRIPLKIIGITAASLIVLVTVALCLVVWILTPERLTPIAEKVANENLVNAHVKLGKVELTVWDTFPFASVDIENLQITSNALKNYGDTIPAYADSLFSVGKMRAEIDLAKLPLMKVDIREILIDSPRANIVALNDSVANYMIFPASSDTTTSEVTIMPDVVVNKFRITNNQGLRYTDLAMRMSATLRTDSVELDYNNADHFYSLLFKGGILAEMPDYHLNQVIPFCFDGDINWNTKDPYHCTLRNFKADFARIPVNVNADFAFGDTVAVRSFNMALGPIKYSDLTDQIPNEYLHGLERIKTDFAMSMKLALDKPFLMGVDKQPYLHAELLIPECYIQPGKYDAYRINRFKAGAKIAYNGDNPDKSTVDLSELLLDGFGIRMAVAGNATNLFKDPKVDASMKGNIDFAKLLKLLPANMQIDLAGKMGINTSMQFALSDLDVKNFQRIHANGTMDFSDVRYSMPQDSMLVFVDHAGIKFGTDSKFRNKNNELKNLLMASISVDSASASMPGVKLTLNNASVGAGGAGRASDFLDTTNITPIGARIKIGKLTFANSIDSSMLRLRGLESNGSITRFQNADRLPLMNFNITANRIRYRDRTTSLGLRDGKIQLSANARPKKENKRMQRMKARIDSMCRVYPELSRDSVIAIYMSQRHPGRKPLNADEYMDLSVDNRMKKFLRRWDMRGSLQARRGSMFTPYFPLRNVLRDVDMNFTADTFNINSLRYTVGHSDLAMRGTVSNIRSSLLGQKRRPLTIEFDVVSDTMDVNQLMKAMYRGTAFSADSTASSTFNFNSVGDDDDSKMQMMVDSSDSSADTTVHHALIIPKNLALSFKIRNKFTRYSDLDLTNLRSDLFINNGVLSLRNLSGDAEGGHLRLDMVYATADKRDIGIGLFMELDDIQVGRFLKLMPDVDTVMPMLKGVDGLINARLGATSKVDSLMNIITPTTNAALSINGKNLVLLDSETFRKIAKMLMFKNKQRNLVDSLSVELAAYDSKIDIYPFILNMDRYSLGIMGTNDFDMNYDFHISILKSPIPFKFGLNITGNADDMKIRVGKAKLKENQVARTALVTDTTKQNLFKQMGEIFKRGAEAAIKGKDLEMYGRRDRQRMDSENRLMDESDKLSSADSLQLINEGIIARPDSVAPAAPVTKESKQRLVGKRKRNRNNNNNTQLKIQKEAIKPDNEQ